MPFATLVDTSTLAEHLAEADWAIVDCRFRLDDPPWGEREYATGHLPGAVYARLDRDLAGVKTGTNGRHPLPDPHVLTATLGRMGIGPGVQVVAYDQDNGMFASRCWWLLRWLGHDAVAVLDGGLARWLAEGRPIEAGGVTRPARSFVATLRPGMVADAADVETVRRAPRARLIDARAPERFRGENETLDKTAGHIPGAANRFFKDNVRADGTLRALDDLRREWTQTLGETAPDQVVCYCGSGVTACQNLLTLEHVGLTGARLYPGSWSEWSSDPTRATAKGTD